MWTVKTAKELDQELPDMILDSITPEQFYKFKIWYSRNTSVPVKELNQLTYELWDMLKKKANIGPIITFSMRVYSGADGKKSSMFMFYPDGDWDIMEFNSNWDRYKYRGY